MPVPEPARRARRHAPTKPVHPPCTRSNVKRSLPLLVLAAVALLVPATTLAADPPAANRFFEIRALVLGNDRIVASGKLWLQGTSLGASVGCNSIGAEVRVEGDTVTIVGPAMMTEMACPGFDGNAENVLLKILDLGKFTIADGKWIADGGAIEVVEGPAPDPNVVPPDGPISNDPVPGCVNPDIDPGFIGRQPATTPAIAPAPPNPNPVPCGGGLDQGTGPNPGIATDAASRSIVDTARDVLFVPLAIGFGVLVLVTVGLLLRGKPTPR
jgi:hypothetical protein